MEKDIGLSREELIEMLKKSEARNAALAAEVSSLRNGAADSEARIAGYEKDLGILRDEKRKAERRDAENRKRISELTLEVEALKELAAEEKEKRLALEKEALVHRFMTKAYIRKIYANSQSEKTSALAKEGIALTPAGATDHPSDSPDTVKAAKEGKKRGRREGTVNFGCIPGKAETVDTAPSKTPVCESCGVTMDERGAQEFYKLSYVPGYFRKTRYIVHCYVCPHCGKTCDTSDAVRDAYGLSGCTPSLGAMLGYVTFLACVPETRASKALEVLEMPLSKELVSRYNMRTADILSPLRDAMLRDARECRTVHMDETTYLCLKAENGTNFFWAAVTGREEKKRMALYFYENDRKYEHAEEIMGKLYGGTLVTDQYGAYARFPNVQYCFSHLERPLIGFLEAYPEESRKDRDYLEVRELVGIIRKAFAEEAKLRDLSEEERLKARRGKVRPLIAEYFDLARKYCGDDGTPKNRAIRYGLDEMSHYFLFLDDGAVPMTNNRAERGVRAVKIYSQGTLFSVSERGAGAAAVMLSVIQSAVLNGLNPLKYLEYLLIHHGNLRDPEKVGSCLPYSPDLPEELYFTAKEKRAMEEEKKETNRVG